MTECRVCGSHKHTRPCSYCGETVCNRHRLPENHECDNIEAATPPRTVDDSSGWSLPSMPPLSYAAGIIVIILLVAAVVGGGSPETQQTGYNESIAVEAAVERVNEARDKEGLLPLEHSTALSERSEAWSAEMAAAGKLYHGSVACRPGAENIAETGWREQVRTEQGIVYHGDSESLGRGLANQWLNSSQHRQNIMDRQFTTVGIGVKKSNNRVYATQRLCG